MAMDWARIEDALQVGREQAVLGEYAIARAKYDLVVRALSAMTANCIAAADQAALAQCRDRVKQEMQYVQEIEKLWSCTEHGSKQGAEKNILDDFPVPAGPVPAVVGPPRLGPPQWNLGADRGPDEPNDGRWSPPPPRERPTPARRHGDGRIPPRSDAAMPAWAQRQQAQQAAPAPKRVPRRAQQPVPGSPELGAPMAVPARMRNYAKPWKAPESEKSKDPSTRSAAAEGEGKSSYAQHVYNDRGGSGPDTELIEMIERDCVENSVNVEFDSIAGHDEAKQLLEEAVVYPLLMPDYFQGIRRPWKGVLMFGPPGTGKTLLAKAVATECNTTFFSVSASTMASKYRGDSEKLVRLLFEMARFYAPTTVFFDEIDALGSKRGSGDEHEASRRVKSELLVQMDGVTAAPKKDKEEDDGEEEKPKIVMCLAATNHPWDLDEALRRRLEKRIYIPLPEETSRKDLFGKSLADVRLSEEVCFDELVKRTEGYSGADICNVCREAALMGMRAAMKEARAKGLKADEIQSLRAQLDVPVTQQDLLSAVKNVQRSVGNEDLKRFVEWMAEFGSA
mmetsp:Transcript_10419/g.22865  ORF Transcript_10419/g.22865 Transcript_10419/m.22865 type:complete len:565 (+) Transcript_10419:24-1718(+)|eukprot:CAMPEP_0204351970 /NCGR_PEP_ID=MMETSP0469-20131031/31515_1 /ASSEMBLY_ACC=CAM_ASM_000384 /TAXON_ID=2969 /ORGANISM="Oxyrrhis marina" /LENGTH=564 /DNA_ID=CAMNT_0051338623 /DNA_START=17 /DNA_END=1711 /DNA_ORIENTATION=+